MSHEPQLTRAPAMPAGRAATTITAPDLHAPAPRRAPARGAAPPPPVDYQAGHLGAQLASLAYCTSSAKLNAGLTKVDGGGWAPAYMFTASYDTQGYCTQRRTPGVTNKYTLVVAFRGTESLTESPADWFVNIDAVMSSGNQVIDERFSPEGVGPGTWVAAHKSAIDDVWTWLEDFMKTHGGGTDLIDEILVVGHSLGGVLALYELAALWSTLDSSALYRPGLLHLYTYGMPPSTNAIFRSDFSLKLEKGIIRSDCFISVADPVTNPVLLWTVFLTYGPVPLQHIISFSGVEDLTEGWFQNHLVDNYVTVLDALQQPAPPTGPWGGPGGDAFNDELLIAAPLDFIRSIQVRSGSRIDAIQLFTDRGASARHGGDTGDLHTFTIEPDDFLVHVSGTWGQSGGHTVVCSLTLRTRAGHEETYGKESSTPFAFDAPDGTAIRGFFGRSGSALDALGVLLGGPLLIKFYPNQGGTGGDVAFSDSSVLTPFSRIAYLIGVKGPSPYVQQRVVNGIGLTYDDTGTTSLHVGTKQGTQVVVPFAQDEYITSVRGWLAQWASSGHDTVCFLEVGTNLGNKYSFGSTPGGGAPEIVFDAEEGCEIIGFTGKTGSSLDSLGVITRPVPGVENLHMPASPSE